MSFAFETILVVGVLYLLTTANTLLKLPQVVDPVFGSLNALAFVASVLVTRRTILGEADNLRREIVILTAVSIACGVLLLLASFFIPGRSPKDFAPFIAQAIVAIPLTLALWKWFAIRYQVLDGYRERVLIVGSGENARQVARWIGLQLPHQCELVGFAHEDGSRFGQVLAMGARVWTSFGELAKFTPGRVDRIVVALDEKRGKLPLQELMQVRLSGIEIEDATSFFERASGKLAVETMLPSWLVFSDGFKVSAARRVAKRLADIVISFALLLLAAPLMVLTAILIALESGRPIFYRQKRVGVRGVEFEMLKFRSMVKDAEKRSGPMWAGTNDARVTRVGSIIRKFRIDELPQLVNVLRGEMSFVGPRPERRHFVMKLEKEIEYYSLRTIVRPGITGWAQVMYPYGATTEDAREKLKYDLFYIKNCNVLYDLWILLKTVKVVLTASGAR